MKRNGLNPYKALANGAFNVPLYNSRNKMIDYIQFVTNVFCGKINGFDNFSVDPKRPLYKVFHDLVKLDIRGRLKDITGADDCKYSISEDTGKPCYKIFYVSQEQPNTLYSFDISYIEMLKAESYISYELLLECIRFFAKKGVSLLDHYYLDFAEPDYLDDMFESKYSYMDDEDEKKDFVLDLYKWNKREMPGWIRKEVFKNPSRQKIQNLLYSLPMDRQYHDAMVKVATCILEIYDCYPFSHYCEKSRDYFFKNYDLPYDQDDHESNSINYEDLFFISYMPTSIYHCIVHEVYEQYANEYGVIEYIKDYPVRHWSDLAKLKKIDFSRHAILQRLPKLFEEASDMSDAIECHFNNKYEKKWIKEIGYDQETFNFNTFLNFIKENRP